MKKTTFLAIILFSVTAFSQGTLKEGGTQLNLGVGFSDWGTPVFLGLDYGLGNNFTLGGEVSYRSYSDNFNYGFNEAYQFNYTVIGLGANVNYHFNEVFDLPKKWDIYGGASLNYFIWKNSYKYKGNNPNSFFNTNFNPNYGNTSGLGFGLQAGVRYFFNNKWGINFETGGGTIFGGKIGLTYKFGGSK
jgi:outer membrane immunogenic protein